MTEEHIGDVPGYVLNALEADEQARGAQHVATCPRCQGEIARVAEALHGTFGVAAPAVQPSPLLRTQFLARLALELTPAEAGTVPGRPATVAAPRQPARSQGAARTSIARLPYLPRWLIGAAVPSMVAIVLLAFTLNMRQQLDDQRAHLFGKAIANPHVAMLLRGPAAKQGMAGEVLVPEKGTAGLLIVSGLPAPSGSMGYNCWLRRNGRWADGGALKPDSSGIAMLVLDEERSPRRYDDLVITMEHMDRPRSEPSSPMLLGTSL